MMSIVTHKISKKRILKNYKRNNNFTTITTLTTGMEAHRKILLLTNTIYQAKFLTTFNSELTLSGHP